jgi:putative FmdB family regulatory protein
MPIYEFACPRCRVVFNFFSKRVQPEKPPVCPKCGHKKMIKEVSRFAPLKGGHSLDSEDPSASSEDMPELDNPRVQKAMNELERDMAHMEENNPRHMAHIMKKMKDLMPSDTLPKELDAAIKRLEAGEDPEKIEEDMGDVLGDLMDDPKGGPGPSEGGFSRDPNLYDY